MSFQLPPEITVSKDQIDSQWVFTFRHNELGNIGRIRLKGTGANTMINLDVIGPCTFPKADFIEKVEFSLGFSQSLV